MEVLTLRDGLEMYMEPYNGKVRIVIQRDKADFVCRMETLGNLKEFVALKEAKIFKGRLQLYKEEGLINVIVKNKAAGIVDEGSFEKCLDEVKW